VLSTNTLSVDVTGTGSTLCAREQDLVAPHQHLASDESVIDTVGPLRTIYRIRIGVTIRMVSNHVRYHVRYLISLVLQHIRHK
jgi:hypothetical protein